MEEVEHPQDVIGYNGSLSELAKAIGRMRYDKVAEFIQELSDDIKSQADADLNIRGRKKLSQKLFEAAQFLDETLKAVNGAWKICKPYMKEDDK